MTNKKNPKFARPESGRVRRFAFSWYGGGYNDVYARDKADAIEVAHETFPQTMTVNEGSVIEVTDNAAYEAGLPYWD